jgi:glutamine synthetase
VLKLFGKDVMKVSTTVGPEQEYFLVDAELYKKRPDLLYTGRTLFGAPSPKGQELDDQYFAAIKDRVASFMEDLNVELWKLGILAKTEHNEVAPAQHELAPIFTTTNIATDHNQLVMEKMKKVAWKHGLMCLLHEKPFDGVNGSGKHNNWSLSTDSGENLLDPGSTPADNAQFLLFLTAVIKAVDEYQDILRISVATAGNDHRLGANEAPPAIISMFVGEELDAVINSIISGKTCPSREKTAMDIGVTVLPEFFKDTTDRNRTSPFAFTGNKFEFRMPGSSLSIAGPNTVLNTIVAETLSQFADVLEGSKDFDADLATLIKKTLTEHQRILFNGNGYDDSWIAEAEKRGLSNLDSTPAAVPHMLDEKNVQVFTKHGVYSRVELESRTEIALENYSKQINIEARTMLHMVTKRILPACVEYSAEVANSIASKKAILSDIPCKAEMDLLTRLSVLTDEIYDKNNALQAAADGATMENMEELAMYYRKTVLPAMEDLRASVDAAEILVAKDYWPYPSYGDLLFRI